VENTSTKRDIALDVAKGLAIILIVYFHVLETYVGDWQTTTQLWYWAAPNHFALPLFVFISGYLVHKLEFKQITHRAQQLMIPYLVWSIVLFFFTSFIATGFLVHGNLFKTLLYDFWTLTTSSLWFLPALLVLYIIVYMTRGKLWVVLLAISVMYGLSQIPWPTSIGNVHIPETAWFLTLAWFLPFFAAGYFISKYREKLHALGFVKWFCLVAFPVLFILGGKLSYTTSTFGWPNIFATKWDIAARFFAFGMGFLGIGMVFAVSSILAKLSVIRWPFQFLGKITLGIYCSHALFRTIGIGSGIPRVLLTILITLLITATLVWLLQRTRITNFLFLGVGQKPKPRKIETEGKTSPAFKFKEQKPDAITTLREEKPDPVSTLKEQKPG
jgi:fucose 4-O-acetylase-like acetyltransferase